jgi:hypothetical protein
MSDGGVCAIADEAAMRRCGENISLFLGPGDVLALYGDLGAGKTTLARAIIRALAPDYGEFEVPSPTFTLVQPYDFTRVPVHHFDLYRIEQPEEIEELGLDAAMVEGAVIIEWPDRLAHDLPADRLDITIGLQPGGTARQVTLTGQGTWSPRVERMAQISRFVARSPFAECRRTFLQGDASSRRYERLVGDAGAGAVLMDMPARADSVPVRDGLPYSTLVHLADDVRPFVAVGNALRALDLNAPQVFAHDLDAGFLLIEDFGDRVFGGLPATGADIESAYAVACDVLAHLAAVGCPLTLPLPDGSKYEVPTYDAGAMHVETELLLDWFWPLLGRPPLDDEARDEFAQLWSAGFSRLAAEPMVWVMRDYHSPNLMWLPEAAGLHRIGLLDYQDAVMGSPAYDVVSLLQDARIEVSAEREQHYLDYYIDLRQAAGAPFEEAALRADYAILGAQRATKILGIFARLKARDGKPGYLRHLPRVSDYLERNLAHPALAALKAWYNRHLPHDVRAAAGNPRGAPS